MKKQKEICRPCVHLADLGIRYGWAYKAIEGLREEKSGEWASWCYIPTHAVKAIVDLSPVKSNDVVRDTGMLTFLATWRATKGVYRFDPDVYESVRNTPVKGLLPIDVFYQMPEWGMYIETPGMQSNAGKVYGCFVYMDEGGYSGKSKVHSLNLLLDADGGMLPVAIQMIDQTVDEALTKFTKDFIKLGYRFLQDIKTMKQVISLLIYLCSSTVEYVVAPLAPRKIKRGKKEWIPPRPTTHDVGVKMGSAIRHYRQVQYTEKGKGSGRPGEAMAPHIRRAHYHHFWKGPLDDRELIVKWLPPIPVNVDNDLPVAIHPVKA